MSQFLSKKDAVKEFLLCGKDPVYFINSYIKLSHPQRGVIPFKTWDFQNDLFQKFNDYQFNIILKSRQLGVTWCAAAYSVWLMIFHREKNIMVICTKFQTAANLVKKVKFMIKNLPPWFSQLATIQFDNKTNFALTNGSEIKAASTATDVGRSEALSLLIIDEAAHIKGLEEIWTAAGATMAAGGRCIAVSSPNGVGNWFYNEFDKAEKGDGQFHPSRLSWNVHPERDEEWERKERKKYSTKAFAQEYECSFLSSGDTIIGVEELKRIHKFLKEPKMKVGFDKNLYIWEEHNPNESYMITADVARGDGTDYSTFHVIKLQTLEQVAEYRGKLSTELFSKLLFDIGREYGDSMIVVENNNLGFSVCEKIIQLNYPNVYFAEKGTQEYIPPYLAKNLENAVAGFTTSHKSRPLMISKLEESIRRGYLVINSERTYKELETFVWNNGKAEAQRGHNDDLVMPLAIACWVKDTALKANERTLEYKKTFLKTMSVAKTKLNTTIPGMIGHQELRKQKNLRAAQEQMKKFGWLFKG